MADFSKFFLLDRHTVSEYAFKILKRFPSVEDIDCSEIGDGNINYVFMLRSKSQGHSLVIKQADKLLRSSGRPLDIYRSRIEARALELQHRFAPEFVPEVFHYDETMALIAMEDISEYKNLRYELLSDRNYSHLPHTLSDFIAQTLLPCSDLVMDRAEKKQMVKFFINPELCDISEDLVFTEPYYNYKDRNIISPGMESFVEKELYNDSLLHAHIASVRNNFMNNAQTLIHGDLHSGSIFVNSRGIKVIDPEFAFYGPMGYDIGNVLGNLCLSYGNRKFCGSESAESIADTAVEFFRLCFEKLDKKYDECVEFPLYRNATFKAEYLASILADSAAYAGTEIIRRVVGDSKTADVNSVTDKYTRIAMETYLIKLGKALILNHNEIKGADELCALLKGTN